MDIRYTDTHEFVAKDGAEFIIGITDHAQESLGDIVFVELPAVGAHFAAKAGFAVVESVKAASDIYLPIAGTITAVNDALSGAPETINQDCYGKGWIAKIKADNDADFDALLDEAAYKAIL
ncbi:MAG: glycine cleavage system protein GcvH [Spirochaetaceae bacterium]|jgi:glycine cleavage system H protein|nr:glycine cleavage system protein GcvH [Spirochaetaceae bacterium]